MSDVGTLDRQLLVTEPVRFCKKCVISSQRPRITFDDVGVCSACRYAEIKASEIDWDERDMMLLDLLAKHRSKDGSYDCVVPGSGGKDSFYASHILKTKYKMHPLTVTWAPTIYTDWGLRNFHRWIHAGHDNYLNTPNGKIHRLLTRLSVDSMLHKSPVTSRAC